MKKSQVFALLLGPILYIFFSQYSFNGLPIEGSQVLALTLWMATWWLSEAVPIAVTALLPLLILPLSNTLDFKQSAAFYSHPIIYLFLGGFILAKGIERWNVHKRIALQIILKVGQSPAKVILGFMLATAFLSMWISNTATTIMMLPIGLAIVQQLYPKDKQARNSFAKALLLSIAYAASIGGIATLIGTPTNVIFTGVVQEQFKVEISFAQWMLFALPIASVLFTIAWAYLAFFRAPLPQTQGDALVSVRKDLNKLGQMRYEEKAVLSVFTLVALGWMIRKPLLNPYFPMLNDSIIALAGAIALFVIPRKQENTQHVDTSTDSFDQSPNSLLDWDTAVRIPWGVILLFGGGLTLANAFKISGLAEWIGQQIVLIEQLPLFLIVLLLIAAVNFLTEITSNIATVSMILPIVSALAFRMGVHPYILMISATCAASCAFMLPVATAPNAIVFGANYLKIGDMMRAGLILNLLSIVLFSLYIYFIMPFIFNINILHYPF